MTLHPKALYKVDFPAVYHPYWYTGIPIYHLYRYTDIPSISVYRYTDIPSILVYRYTVRNYAISGLPLKYGPEHRERNPYTLYAMVFGKEYTCTVGNLPNNHI